MKNMELRYIVKRDLDNQKTITNIVTRYKNLGNRVKDYYITETGDKRLREYIGKNKSYYLIKGNRTNKKINDISETRFKRMKFNKKPFIIIKDVVGVVDNKMCLELLTVNNRLYFSIEIEDTDKNKAISKLKEFINKNNLINGEITDKSLYEYFNKGVNDA